MKKLISITIIILVLLLSGCKSPEAENKKNDKEDYRQTELNNETKPMNNKNVPRAADKSPNKDYYQSDEKGIATDGTEENIFATDDTREIAQLLAIRTDIRQSQVAELKDRIVITLMTNPNEMDNQTISSIKDDIQEVVPEKEVFIYTDEYHWNRMKDLDASLQQRKMGEAVEEFMEKHFNIDIKD